MGLTGPHSFTERSRQITVSFRPTNGRPMPRMTGAIIFLTAACALLPQAGAQSPTAAPTATASSSSSVRFTHTLSLSHIMVLEHTHIHTHPHAHTQTGSAAAVLVLIVICCCCFNCCCSDGKCGFLFGNKRQRPVDDSTGRHGEGLETSDDAAAPKRAPKEAKWADQFTALMTKQVVMTWRNLLGTVRVFVVPCLAYGLLWLLYDLSYELVMERWPA